MYKAILKTAQNRQKFRDGLDTFIDERFKEIDVTEMMKNPRTYLEEFVSTVAGEALAKFGAEYVLEGLRFGKEMREVVK